MRHIDDMFFVWTHGEDELYNFLKGLNSFHPKIKFKSESYTQEIKIFDLTVKWNNNQLVTKVSTANLQIDSNNFIIIILT